MMPVWTKLGVFDFSQGIQRHENKEAWAAYRPRDKKLPPVPMQKHSQRIKTEKHSIFNQKY
jgi:hypothetical protein